MNEINKSAAFWRTFPIFEGFSKETIGEIAAIATYRKWPAGTVKTGVSSPGLNPWSSTR